jgi:ABC-2 type transport system ATP-binding protein
MEEADSLCHRIAIVDHGKLIALGTPAELKSSIPGGFVVRLHLDAASDTLLDALRGLGGVSDVRAKDGGQVDVYADRGGALVPDVVTAVTSARSTIRDLHISEPSLENLFLHHTGRSLRE